MVFLCHIFQHFIPVPSVSLSSSVSLSRLRSAICISSYSKTPSTANSYDDLKGRLSTAAKRQNLYQYQENPYFPNIALPSESNIQSCYPQASDEEDLVVDEVVSLSMVGKGRRQRSESLCSVSGPCVPPDLLLNTCKVCQRQILEVV